MEYSKNIELLKLSRKTFKENFYMRPSEKDSQRIVIDQLYSIVKKNNTSYHSTFIAS